MNIRRILSIKKRFKNREDIILRDYLAMERTKLANERTLLSYIRSSLYLLVGGIALIQLEGFERVQYLGYVSLCLTVVFLLVGLYRFIKLNRILRNYYREIDASHQSAKTADSPSGAGTKQN
ncbi:MAG TPA: DUF202 domain-containing protein [Cryomorphaceae bacterium]|nr:DUF202 domain-containing protein [Cryomorphaceae bacterium]